MIFIYYNSIIVIIIIVSLLLLLYIILMVIYNNIGYRPVAISTYYRHSLKTKRTLNAIFRNEMGDEALHQRSCTYK